MKTHPETEQLSAFVDGELTQREQVSLEAHLASCRECSALLAALRATVGDLATLEQPPMDERAAWAIRKAVARERRLGGRARRYGWMAGAAAASIAGILAFVLVSKGGGGSADSAGSAGPPAELAMKALDYDAKSAQAELQAFASGYGDAAGSAPMARSEAKMPVPTPAGAERREDSGFKGADQLNADAFDEGVKRCEASVRSGGGSIRLVHAIAASYEGTPAYLLFFEAPPGDPQRIELWIVDRGSCDVLLFRQQKV